ncbi:MAG: cupredoxin domain-containing protein [Nitrososphaerota archaeon]|nr:cupredoxin domain-containing protein [Nitrososphaerota archaeon]
MASPATSTPARTLSATGPVIIVILIIVAAIIGFYEVVYYPSVAKTSTTTTTTVVQPSKYTVKVIIAAGAGGSPNAAQTYVPDTITVYIGYNATVDWINNDSTVHTVTASANAPDPRFNQFGPVSQPWNNVWQNGSTSGPNEVNFTFTVPGTYTYYCSYHIWMKGTVIVKQAPPGLITGTTNSTIPTTTATSSGAAAIATSGYFAKALTDLASSFATLTGSATAPWSVNLSSSLLDSF